MNNFLFVLLMLSFSKIKVSNIYRIYLLLDLEKNIIVIIIMTIFNIIIIIMNYSMSASQQKYKLFSDKLVKLLFGYNYSQ